MLLCFSIEVPPLYRILLLAPDKEEGSVFVSHQRPGAIDLLAAAWPSGSAAQQPFRVFEEGCSRVFRVIEITWTSQRPFEPELASGPHGCQRVWVVGFHHPSADSNPRTEQDFVCFESGNRP